MYHLWFVCVFPRGIPQLQSDRSLPCDHGLDYASQCENNNNNNNFVCALASIIARNARSIIFGPLLRQCLWSLISMRLRTTVALVAFVCFPKVEGPRPHRIWECSYNNIIALPFPNAFSPLPPPIPLAEGVAVRHTHTRYPRWASCRLATTL